MNLVVNQSGKVVYFVVVVVASECVVQLFLQAQHLQPQLLALHLALPSLSVQLLQLPLQLRVLGRFLLETLLSIGQLPL